MRSFTYGLKIFKTLCSGHIIRPFISYKINKYEWTRKLQWIVLYYRQNKSIRTWYAWAQTLHLVKHFIQTHCGQCHTLVIPYFCLNLHLVKLCVWSHSAFSQTLYSVTLCIMTSDLKTSFAKVSQCGQINVNIKSFRHDLFLTSNPKTSVAKVSAFDQLDMKMISENWSVCLFDHKLIHFVTTCSQPPI